MFIFTVVNRRPLRSAIAGIALLALGLMPTVHSQTNAEDGSVDNPQAQISNSAIKEPVAQQSSSSNASSQMMALLRPFTEELAIRLGENGLLGRYSGLLSELPSIEGLASQAELLNAHHYLVLAEFTTVENSLRQKGLDAYLTKVEAAKENYQAVVVPFLSALNLVVSNSNTEVSEFEKGLYFAELRKQLAVVKDSLSAQSPQILRINDLPVQPLSIATKAPVYAPVIIPSYEGNQADQAVEMELDTNDITQDVAKTAKDLGYDPIKIFEFVQNEISTELYFGSVKGGQGTLFQRAGSETDQALLLSQLLRASGLNTSYVSGVIHLDSAQLLSFTGTTSAAQALEALQKAGIPHTPKVKGGRLQEAEVSHTWVSVQVPYANYRGATIDHSGLVWLPLMPAIAARSVITQSPVDVDVSLIVNELISDSASLGVNDVLRREVGRALSSAGQDQNFDDLLMVMSHDHTPAGYLPNSLPVTVIATTNESNELPAELVHKIRLKIKQSSHNSSDIALSAEEPISRLYGRDVVLSYQPASREDHNLVLSFGGLDNTPLYLVDVRPVLQLNGLPLKVGSQGIAAGTQHQMTIELVSPSATVQINKSVFAGGYHSLSTAMNGVRTNPDQNSSKESVAGKLLNKLARNYAQAWYQDGKEIADYAQRRIIQPMAAAVFVSSDTNVTALLDQPFSLDVRGINMDAAFFAYESVVVADSSIKNADFSQLLALQGSYLEHRVFENTIDVESVSADKVFALAKQAGSVILELELSDVNTLNAQLGNHQPAVIEDVKSWLELGYSVSIPEQQVSYIDWRGSAWIVVDPLTRASGYFISRGLAGGATAEPLPGDIQKPLQNPRSELPNKDVTAVSAVFLFPSTDLQIDSAGEEFDPVKVRVVDSVGAPVEGATVVFSVGSGAGKFVATSDGVESTTVSVETDGSGSAQAVYKSANLVTDNSITNYVVESDGGVAQLTGTSYLNVRVLRGARPPLDAKDSFTLFTKAGEPARLRHVVDQGTGLIGAHGYAIGPAAIRVEDRFGNAIAGADIDLTIGAVKGYTVPANASGDVIIKEHSIKGPACPDVTGYLDPCGTKSLTRKSNANGYVYVKSILGFVNVGRLIPLTATYPINVSYADQLTLELPFRAEGFASTLYTGPSLKASVKLGDLYKGAATATIVVDPFTPQKVESKEVKVKSDGFEGSASFTGQLAVHYTDQETGGSHGKHLASISWDLFDLKDELIRTQVSTSPDGVTAIRFSDIDSPEIRVDKNSRATFFEPIDFEYFPADYEPHFTHIEIFEDDVPVFSQLANGKQVTLPPLTFDPQKAYTAEVVLNKGLSENEVRSDRFDLTISAPIIKELRDGYAASGSAAQGAGSGAIIVDDINDATCLVKPPKIVLSLLQDASVTIKTRETKYRNSRTFLNRKKLKAGEHEFTSGDIGFNNAFFHEGITRFDVTAVADKDGKTERSTGVFSLSIQELSPLPIGSPVYDNINLFKGNLFLSRSDVVVPGRGPNIEVTRSYSSSNTAVSNFGVGWGHNYDSYAQLGPCGWVTVSGGVAGGVTFFPTPDGKFAAGKGYHSSLEYVDSGWNFYAKDGTLYRYSKTLNENFTSTQFARKLFLDYIQDTNGNVTQLVYNAKETAYPKIDLIRDSSGREIQFEYTPITDIADEIVTAEFLEQQDNSDGVIVDENWGSWNFIYPHARDVITAVTGLDYRLEYTYDKFGRLVNVKNSDQNQASSDKLIEESYQYGQLFDDPEAQSSLLYDIAAATAIKTLTDHRGVETTYSYQRSERLRNANVIGDTFIPFNNRNLLVINTQKVDAAQSNPQDIVASLAYTGKEFEKSSADATVIDPLGVTYTYKMDRFGRAFETTGPTGIKIMTWANNDTVMISSLDENGVLSEYTYDGFGNQTSSKVSGPNGGVFETQSTYETDTANIRNLLKTRTDRRGNTTRYGYDTRGNLTSVSTPSTRDCAGACTVSYTYNLNGDRSAMRDKRGKRTAYHYDRYGNVVDTYYPIGNTSAGFDERGRVTHKTDENGNQTHFEYDWLNRLISQRNAEGGERSYEYDPNNNKTLEVDELGRAYRQEFDFDNRVISSSVSGNRNTSLGSSNSVSKTYVYDQNGNLLSQTDYRGNVTEHIYDDANRTIKTTLPANEKGDKRVIEFEYDNATSVVKQTVSAGTSTGAQVTQFEYDNLYRQTQITDPLNGVTQFKFDGNDNLIEQTDELGRITQTEYDANNLKVSQTDAVGTPVERRTQWRYDRGGNVLAVTDARANKETYNYDDRSRLIFKVNAAADRHTYQYDDFGNLTDEYDHFNNHIETKYDQLHRKISVMDQRGFETSTTYDLVGNPVSESWPNGNVVTRGFDFLNRKTQESDTIGALMAYAYDADGNPTQIIDAKGYVTQNRYDKLGQLTQVSAPENQTVSSSYDVFGNVLSSVDAEGNITEFEYDKLNRKIKETDANRNDTTVVYDAVDNVLSQSDKRGNTTTWTYDELNRATQVTEPLAGGHSRDIVNTYDANDNLVSTTDKRGITTEHDYDALNRVIEERRDGIPVVKNTYSDIGDLIGVEDANGNVTAMEYNERHELILESRPETALSRYIYDAMGDVVKHIDPEGREAFSTYDERRRKLSSTNGEGETTQFTYDLNNNQLTKVRPLGNTWAYAYDELNRLLSITDADDQVSRYAYDKQGNVISHTDANNNVKRYEYDALNRKAVMHYPATTGQAPVQCVYNYDENSNLISELDANNQTKTHAYDALNRLVSTTYQNPSVTTGRDLIEQTFAYDGNNNRTQVTETYTVTNKANEVRTDQSTYDRFDRLFNRIDSHDKIIQYGYDVNGNRTRLIDSDGILTTYSYDGLNRVSSVTTAQGATNYEYDRSSLLTSISYPNNTQATYTYDLARRSTAIHNVQNTATVSRFEYEYDLNGNRTVQRETNGGAEETTRFEFDSNDRLTKVTYPSTNTTYGYDAAYNRISEVERDNASNAVSKSKTYAYNQRNQLTDVSDNVDASNNASYTFDQNGNQVSKTKDGTQTLFEFDIRDDLRQVTVGGSTVGQFLYDHQGLRIEKLGDRGLEKTTYDDQSVLQQYGNDDKTRAKFDYGANRLLSLIDLVRDPFDASNGGINTIGKDEPVSFYLYDALQSVVNLTNNQGAVQTRTQYDAWGHKRADTGTSYNRFAFTGYEEDKETGLLYAKARFYDPDTGKFLSEDAWDGDNLIAPSLHKYLYAYQNPTVYVDPTGNNPQLLARQKYEQQRVAEMLQANLATKEGQATYNEYQQGQHEGAVDTLKQFATDTFQGVKDLAGAGMFIHSNGRIGAEGMSNTIQGVKSTAEAIGHPIQTGQAVMNGIEENAKRHDSLIGDSKIREAGRIAGARDTKFLTTVGGFATGAGAARNLLDLRKVSKKGGGDTNLVLESDRSVVPNGGDFKFNSQADPLLDSMGSARRSHPAEYRAIMKDLDDNNVAVKNGGDSIAFSPNTSGGRLGNEILLPNNFSISALRHEYGHFLDHKALGSPRYIEYFKKPELIVSTERRQYLGEIRTARQVGDKNARKTLIQNYLDEKKTLVDRYYQRPYGGKVNTTSIGYK